MSASRRTDTRRISKNLAAIALVMFAAVFSMTEIARGESADPEVGSLSVAVPISLPQTLPQNSVSLLEGLSFLDISRLLGSVLPNELVLTGGLQRGALASALFDLVQYMRNHTDTLTPNDVLATVAPYRRVEMFGTWVNENAPQDCYNTRAEVLMRDATGAAKIAFSTGNPCQVARGAWHDPYSGTDYKLASAVQIDHVVPLKNAYRSGAHSWTRERRCHYANYLSDPQHLLAVSGHENMAKGDSGPENYLPPDPGYVCAYIANWMRIKATWGMQFSGDEKAAIEKELRDRNCSVSSTRPKLSDIQQNRAASNRMNVKCADPIPVGR